MRLTRVALRDFMGYEEADLDLGSVGATVVVGDNGSGKSTLLDAITWTLYDRVARPDLSSQDALIRDGADQTMVVVEFTTPWGDAVITREKARGRTGTLSLIVNGGPRTAHTQAETRATIAGLIGLTYDAFMAGPVMAQETAGAFMKARPADRKDLLVHLFGLDEFEPLHVEARKRAADHQIEANTAEMMVRGASAAMAVEPSVRADLATAEANLGTLMEAQSLAADRIIAHKATLAATARDAQRYESAKANLAALLARLRHEDASTVRLVIAIDDTAMKIAAASEPIYDLPPSDKEALFPAAEAAYEVAAAARGDLLRVTAELDATRRDYARMDQARANVADVPCGAGPAFVSCRFLREVPTDEHVLAALTAGKVLREQQAHIQSEASEYVARAEVLTALRQALAARHVAEARIAERRDGQTGLVAALEQTLASHKAALHASDEASIRLKADAEAAEIERDGIALALDARREAAEALADAEQVYRQHRDAANAAGAAVAGYRASLTAIEKAKTDHEEWSGLLAEHADKRDVYRLLAEAFHRDGIPSAILAEGIPAIEEEANAVLEGLPGALTLALRTQREKKGGGMADTLDVVVTSNGWEREYGMLSVGQRFRVDLALRLGLSRVLTRRGGGRVETLWLDEPLAALDASGREAVMETLGALAADFGLMVVVSHHPDFNDRFGGRIEVSMEDGVSNAVLIA